MELINFSKKKPLYEPQSNALLNLPEDLVYKTFSFCSYKQHCILQKTCKQVHFLLSLDNLNKIIIHNFIIGNSYRIIQKDNKGEIVIKETERKAFFKDIVKKDNLNLIMTILNHAKKETDSYIPDETICIASEQNDSDDSTHISLEPTDNLTQEQYLQNHYLKPLLKAAMKEENITLMNRIAEEELTPDMMSTFHDNKLDILCKRNIVGLMISAVIFTIGIFGTGIYYTINPPSYNITHTHSPTHELYS